MELNFAYLNRIHTRIAISAKDLKINSKLQYNFESCIDDILTYKLNQDISLITNPKLQQAIVNHKEFLKLKYELVYNW